MIERQKVSFDVTEAANLGERCIISGTAFIPDEPPNEASPVVWVMFPGGTYTKDYFHLVVPGHSGYSAAAAFAAAGAIVVTLDHLGTGESTFPRDGRRVSLEVMASANTSAVVAIREALSSGALNPGVPRLPALFLVGFGHSLGGYLLQIQQAMSQSFDAIVIAGSTCQTMRGLEGQSDTPARIVLPAENDGYFLMPRAQNHGSFYWNDVPPDVIAADDLSLSPLPVGSMDIGVAGRTVPYAREITCPVFLAFGDQDLSPDPHREPQFYPKSRDVTLFLLANSGHCHNSASTRGVLWERAVRWASDQREMRKRFPLHSK